MNVLARASAITTSVLAVPAGRHRSGGTLRAVVPTRPFLVVSPADSRVAC